MKCAALILLGLCLFALILVPLVVTQIEWRQSRETAAHSFTAPLPAPQIEPTAVVYFSRSGNTRLAARFLAARLGAELIELRDDDYRLGVVGWVHSLHDARGHDATITPATLDLSRYRTVYLGSPIWLYSPAPPIWAFAQNNRFDGQRIVLFNTFNSKLEQHFIDEFRDLVIARGARTFEHRFVNRGRMGAQISTDEMLGKIEQEWVLIPADGTR